MWLDESSSSERLILPRNISVSKLFVTSRARFPALIFQINEFPPNWRMIRKCCNYGEYDRFLNVSCIFAVAVEPIHLFDARHEGRDGDQSDHEYTTTSTWRASSAPCTIVNSPLLYIVAALWCVRWTLLDSICIHPRARSCRFTLLRSCSPP